MPNTNVQIQGCTCSTDHGAWMNHVTPFSNYWRHFLITERRYIAYAEMMLLMREKATN
jgi:hypothetical protein